MNVLFFARLFYPHVGGVEKHVLEISKVLIEKGHSVTVITENYQSLPLIAKFEGINIVRINVGTNDWFKKFRVWRELIKQTKLVRSADIIHCHDIFFWYLPFKLVFPFKKVFTTFHGYEGNTIPNKRAKFMHKISEKLANGNICIGSFYKKWYGTNATYISYGAVSKSLIDLGNQTNNYRKQAMFLGRLEEETGILEYLKVVKENKIKLDVFGEGSLESKAKDYVKKNKLNVTFKGFVVDATDYIKDYKYIFTSRYLGILEAMAFKKPVFSVYNSDIKRDYLKMTPFSAYISISKNGEDLSKAISNYEKEKSNINITNAYNFVKTQTWESMTDLYLSLWKNIIL